jgi:predicted metal-dependent hydrolase
MNNVTLWAAVVSAIVAAASAVASAVNWFRTKKARAEAREQARIATDAAADAAGALKQIAELQTRQDERQQALKAVAERDPWRIRHLPDTNTEAELVNDTDTPKYAVNVTVAVGPQVWQEKLIEFVGPRRAVRIPYIAVGNADVTATITWQLTEGGDSRETQTLTW